MKTIKFFCVVFLILGLDILSLNLSAQWQKFDFPNLRPYNTNSKYMYSWLNGSSYFLRTTNDWQTWDTIYTNFPIHRFAADSLGNVFIANISSNNTKFYLYKNNHLNLILTRPISYVVNLYIHKNYLYSFSSYFNDCFKSFDGGQTIQWFPTYIGGGNGWNSPVSNVVCDTIIFLRGMYFGGPIHPPTEYCYASYDGGNTWQNITNQCYDPSIFFFAHPYIFYGGYYVMRSIDGGHTFQTCSPGLNVMSAAYKNGVILVGTYNNGVYASTNKGDTWIPFNDGLDSLCCNAYVAVTDSFYYVTLNGNTTYRRSIHNLTSITSSTTETDTYLFPNPATDKLTISLPPSTSTFSYQIYDTQSRLILTGKTSNTQTELNVATLTRGLYVLKIITDKQTVTKKVVLQ